MTCPNCHAMNAAKTTTCWSCGKALPPDPPPAPKPEQKPASAKSPRSPALPVQTEAVNADGDFAMGFVAWWFGCICATIIDRRRGFWSAFGGMILSQVLMAIVVLIIIGVSRGRGHY